MTLITAEELLQTTLFHGESEAAVSWVMELLEEVVLQPEQALLQTGQENHYLYIVVSGEVRVELDAGSRSEITRIGPGECVGELSVLDEQMTTAHAIASTVTRLIAIHRRHVWHLISVSHAVARNLLFILSSRVRQDNDNLTESLIMQRQYERLYRQDALTGLFNRYWLDEMLPRMLDRSRHSGQPLGVVMMDVDHFKPYNDNFGHLAGDEVLRTTGRTLNSHIRPTDSAARIGGEEFIVLLPETHADELVAVAKRLRLALKQQQVFNHDGHSLPGITVSVGAALFSGEGDALGLLNRVDRALYQAKSEGRDRVVVTG